MSLHATAAAPAFAYSQQRSLLERLQLFLLWTIGAVSSLVFIEPSPYEFATLAALVLFALAGLTLRASLMPIALLLIAINVGYTTSAVGLFDQKGVLMWILTSWYLAVTAIFFALALSDDTEARLNALMRGIIIGAIIASVAAIIGYSRVIGSLNDLLLLYERARGTFKDPNVLGAYLVLPALLCLREVISAPFGRAARHAVLFALMAAAVLLTFSRAAWGLTVMAVFMMLLLTFLTTQSSSQRLRIVLMTVAGIAAMAMFVAALLSIDAVANLFKERASLSQGYDWGPQGRFGRHALGAILALEVPLGIGPLQFSKYFPEDPHNSFLNAFMAGGWLSGLCYPVILISTLGFGLRAVFQRTPWQPTTVVVFSAYAGGAFESAIIDIDHWRHMFLLLGVLWGLIVANTRHLAQVGATQAAAMAPISPALARR
jgi:hypothetical protein